MKENKRNIEFINKLSDSLSGKISPLNTVNDINKLFKQYINADYTDIVIWDNNNLQLKNFAADWKVSEENTGLKEANYIYTSLCFSSGNKFFFNGEEFNCELQKEDINFINSIKENKNIIILPMVSSSEVFGLIRLTMTKTNEYSTDLFKIMNIAARFISGSLMNYILNEQMEVTLNFYKAMKDIAKIIESQYELSYIIPLIGEMIDRFMSSHLIYIFINKDNRYQLVWPNACKDEHIYEMLNKVNNKTEYLISDNSKIGIFPIIHEENIIGAIAAYSNIEKLLQKDIDYLVQLTRQSGMTIQRANVYAEVLKYATMDALTGLNNRRQFELRLNQEVSNSRRNKTSLCCMMIDVDYFKNVNDTYGHAAGDCVLKQVSGIIKSEIREYDIACRYGGEEFFIILPQTNLKEASFVAQRLRKVIEEAKMDIKDAGTENVNLLKVTVSIGVCAFTPEMNTEKLVQETDKALYEAKTTGRNRVIVN